MKIVKFLNSFVLASLLFSSPAPLAAVCETVRDIGEAGQVALPLAAFAVSTCKRDREGINQLMLTGFMTIGTTYLIKCSINSRRPCGGNGSFPSGHSSAAFAGAAYLQRRYGWRYGLPAFCAAAFVGYSRVHVGMHRPIDVIGSALLALAFNELFTTPYCGGYCLEPRVGRGSFELAAFKDF